MSHRKSPVTPENQTSGSLVMLRSGNDNRPEHALVETDAPVERCSIFLMGRIFEPPPKARGNGARLYAEHQPQRHGEATRFGTIRRLWASALAAAGPSDTAAVRWWFQAPFSMREAFLRLSPRGGAVNKFSDSDGLARSDPNRAKSSGALH
jgi:hypothetical protein